jgi:hypothetical protein
MIPRHLKIMVTILIVLAGILGLSTYRLKHNAERKSAKVGLDKLPVAPPVTGPTSSATLYVADDHTGLLTALPSTFHCLPPAVNARSRYCATC